jgi:hypothetical protein
MAGRAACDSAAILPSMTMLLSLLAEQVVVQASDRRVTWLDLAGAVRFGVSTGHENKTRRVREPRRKRARAGASSAVTATRGRSLPSRGTRLV